MTTKPSHPTLKAALLMMGVVVLIIVMAAINTRNVHRSNFLLGHAWGADLVYDEMLLTGPGDTALIRMPRGPNSWERVLVRLTSAAFAAP